MLLLLLKELLLPVGINIVKSYIESSSSKKDDEILNIVQEGAKYLVPKPNNSFCELDLKKIEKRKMIKTQKSKD